MHCDGCGTEIERGRHFAALELPIPRTLHKKMVEHAETLLPKRMPFSPIALMGGAENMIPNTWKLEICIGCAYGIFPNAAQKVEEQIMRMIENKLAERRMTEQSYQEIAGGDL